MKINAVIESRDGSTLVLDFPRSIYDVYEKLQSVGIRKSPHQITLSDEEGDDVRVKLYSEDEVGKHLLLTLSEQNTLADANMLAFMVDNAKPDFRSKLEQNLLNDQYGSMQEVTGDIRGIVCSDCRFEQGRSAACTGLVFRWAERARVCRPYRCLPQCCS